MKSITLILLMFCGLHICSQTDTAIVRTYGGLYFEEGKQIIECASGGYAVIGTTGSDQLNNTNFYLLRLDEDLNCIWNKVLGGPEAEWGYSIVEDEFGNLLLCGYTNSYGAGGYDVLVYKVDPLGDIIWQKTYGGTDWDFGYKIIAHAQQGFLICGKTYSFGNGDSDGYLLQIGNDGEVLEELTYGNLGEDSFTSILSLTDTQLMVGGSTEQLDGTISTWLVALDNLYFVRWQKLYEDFGSGHCTELASSDESNFLVSGQFTLDGNHLNGFYQKLNSEGEVIFNQSSNEYSVESIVQGAEYLYVAGTTSLFGSGGKAAMILRLDLYSSWQNGAAFGGPFDEHSSQVFVDTEGSVFLLGCSKSYSENSVEDVYLVKFSDPEIVSSYILDLDHSSCFTLDSPEEEEVSGFSVQQDKNQISFKWIDGNYKVQIFDLVGRCVYQNDTYVNNKIVNVTNMSASGFVVVYSDFRNTYSCRFVLPY